MKLKYIFPLLLALLLSGCASPAQEGPFLAATTRPVCCFAETLCAGTGLRVEPLINESVSCLHDYTLSVRQARTAEAAELILCSGAGLEEFMEDILAEKPSIDCSEGIAFLPSDDEPGEPDPHIWLSPTLAKQMVANLSDGLCDRFPEHRQTILKNEADLQKELDALLEYGQSQLAHLSCRELVPFHDGFSYFAQAFDLEILEAVEEEAGSEASARELIDLIGLVRTHALPAIFTETNGSPSAASILSAETGAAVYALDMGMSELDYFSCMRHNIDTIKEALG